MERDHINLILTEQNIPATHPHTVLDALSDLQTRIDTSLRARRHLLAYARAVMPKKYTLNQLAEASGMSISGVRTAYTPDDLFDLLDTFTPSTSEPSNQENEVPWRAPHPTSTDV